MGNDVANFCPLILHYWGYIVNTSKSALCSGRMSRKRGVRRPTDADFMALPTQKYSRRVMTADIQYSVTFYMNPKFPGCLPEWCDMAAPIRSNATSEERAAERRKLLGAVNSEAIELFSDFGDKAGRQIAQTNYGSGGAVWANFAKPTRPANGPTVSTNDFLVTTLGNGVDDTVRKIARSYNALGTLRQIKTLNRGMLEQNQTTVTSSNFTESWNYDKTGNWSQYNRDGIVENRTHNAANEIQGIATHDKNGNMTVMPELKGKYDAWNRLVEVRDVSDNLIARYDYNGRNQRIKKTVGNIVTTSFFNEKWQELESKVGNDTTVYIWGVRYVDDLVLCEKGEERFYSLADPNWNVVAIVSASGVVQERMKYGAFGTITWLDTAFAPKAGSGYAWNRTFTGQVLDSETGLMLYRNRYYHMGFGRFTSRDLIGYKADDVSLYRYVTNSPQTYRDAMGLQGDYFNCYSACLKHHNIQLLDELFPHLAQGTRDSCADICQANPDAYQETYPDPEPGHHCELKRRTKPEKEGQDPGKNGCTGVPDSPLGFNFTGACNTHDECYADCNKTRAQCDEEFLANMQTICQSYSWTELCNEFALLYAGTVAIVGGVAYNSTQEEWCELVWECDDCP